MAALELPLEDRAPLVFRSKLRLLRSIGDVINVWIGFC